MRSLREEWEGEASNWAAWVREPGHDSYHHYGERFFELLPAPAGRTLELGCGEGRVCRDLAARGHRVTGIDASPTLLRLAADADPGGDYVLADAAALPFDDGSFELVVAYNVLMDLDDMPGALHEAARVLVPDGRLCASVTHPTADAGRFEAREPDARFVIEDAYLRSRRIEVPIERNGLSMTFRGWAHPLEAYSLALEDAGFVIEVLREPGAPPDAIAADPAEERWARVPNFLWLRARRW